MPAVPPGFLPKAQAAALGPQAFDAIAFTIGVKSVNTINVALQLKDARNRNVAKAMALKLYLSDAITGLGITATPLTTPPVIGTNGSLLNIPVVGKIIEVTTDALGRVDLNLIQAASPVTAYLIALMPDGSILVSSAITW